MNKKRKEIIAGNKVSEIYEWNLGGYLDVGIVDTMKDLMVNFVGAVVFSIVGVLYLKQRGKGKLAASLIPQVKDEEI